MPLKKACLTVMAVNVVVLALLLATAFQSPVHARAGGGESYRSSGSAEDPALPVIAEPDAVTLQYPPAAADPVLSAEQQSDKEREARETAEWYRQNVRVTARDYDEYRWFGFFMTGFLLVCAAAMTLFMIFGADRPDDGFIKGRLLPLLSINGLVWLLAAAVCSSFAISYLSIALSAVLTFLLLVFDGLRFRRPAAQ